MIIHTKHARHSREQANLFAQMFFDGLFFARMDYQDSSIRIKEKTLEMVWKGSDDLGSQSDLFTHHMKNGYGQPLGYCFGNVVCHDNPFIDDPESEDYNVDRIVDDFIKFAQKYE